MSIVVGDFKYSRDLENRLGRGAFGEVYKGVSTKDSSVKVAIKEIDNTQYLEPGEILDEVAVLKEVSHPNIVKIMDYNVLPELILIVTELCNGGSVQQYLSEQNHMEENDIRILVKHMGLALSALKDKGIIHRDVKPGNIVRHFPTSSSAGANDVCYKLIDFGLGRIITSNRGAHTQCGSLLYMAPEIWNRWEYDYQVDIWGLGISLLQCLTGAHPLAQFTRSQDDLKRVIINGYFLFKEKIPPSTSKELRNLVLKMVNRNPMLRITCTQIGDHPFVTGEEGFFPSTSTVSDVYSETDSSTSSADFYWEIYGTFSEEPTDSGTNDSYPTFTPILGGTASGTTSNPGSTFSENTGYGSTTITGIRSCKKDIENAKLKHQKKNEPFNDRGNGPSPCTVDPIMAFPQPNKKMLKQMETYRTETCLICTPWGRVEWTPSSEEWNDLLDGGACSSPHIMLSAFLGGGIIVLLLSMAKDGQVEMWSCMPDISYNGDMRLPVKLRVDVETQRKSTRSCHIVIFHDLVDYDSVCTIFKDWLNPDAPMFILKFSLP